MARMWHVKKIARESGINLTLVYRERGIKLREYADVCKMQPQNLAFLIKFLLIKLAEMEEER